MGMTPLALRFFAFGGAFWPFGDVGEGEPASSVAFLFFCTPLGPVAPPATGLVARLFVTGLVARLPSGLFARLAPFVFLGTLGLVALFATTECPPKLGDRAGEVALDPTFEPPG
jgi:hypothetical protein